MLVFYHSRYFMTTLFMFHVKHFLAVGHIPVIRNVSRET